MIYHKLLSDLYTWLFEAYKPSELDHEVHTAVNLYNPYNEDDDTFKLLFIKKDKFCPKTDE